MKDLLSIAKEVSNEVLTSKSKKESVNDSMLEILFNQKKELTRVEIVQHITVRRLELKYEDTLKDQKSEDLQKEMKKTMITVKNGVDQSFANGQNNASFSFNPKYKDYEIVSLPNNKYTIKKSK